MIKYNCSAQSPTSLTPQSNGNYVGKGNSNEGVDKEEDNGEGCKSDGYGDEGGR